MTSPLDDALRRTSDAAARYGTPEQMIALAAGSLTQMTVQQRAESGINALIDGVLDIAAKHAGPHDRCATCRGLNNALAVAMGVVRAEVEVEFAAKLGE